MPDNDDNADKKVRELIDESTRAELERWFGLPSFEQLAEQGKPAAPPPDDPEVVALHKRRDAALAAVDPALVEAHRRRVEPSYELIKFKPTLELKVDPDIALFDSGMLDHQHAIAEPREVEISEELQDDLRERVPQALLRDLHRPETDFEKQFEISDPLGEQRVDIAAVVADAMTSKKQALELPGPRYHEACAALREMRAELRRPWAELKTPNRRVTR